MFVWRLAQVKPNADHIAIRNLVRQGFSTFQPLERITIVRAGRFVPRLRSFFPGYLFVGSPETTAPWPLVNSTYGVVRLVKFGDRPTPVPEALIAGLRAACDAQGVIATGPQLAPGSAVEVTFGAFTHFVGKVERLGPDERALVLIDFLGKQTRVSLPVTQLKIASGRSKHQGAAI